MICKRRSRTRQARRDEPSFLPLPPLLPHAAVSDSPQLDKMRRFACDPPKWKATPRRRSTQSLALSFRWRLPPTDRCGLHGTKQFIRPQRPLRFQHCADKVPTHELRAPTAYNDIHSGQPQFQWNPNSRLQLQTAMQTLTSTKPQALHWLKLSHLLIKLWLTSPKKPSLFTVHQINPHAVRSIVGDQRLSDLQIVTTQPN